MLSVSFYIDWQFEEEFIGNLAKCISVNKAKSADSVIIHSMNIASYIQKRNSEVFRDSKFSSIKINLIPPSFSALDYGGGACGSYTLFLARLLKKIGFKTKIVELNVNGNPGGHIALGVETNNKLLLVDPFFNHAFLDSTGNLSDIHEVANNWEKFYSKHLPSGYKPEYNYQAGWHYTNWNKWGLLSESCYKIGSFLLGKNKMDNFSMRYYLLGSNKFYSAYSFSGFLFLVSLVVAPMFKQKKFSLYKTTPVRSINMEIAPLAIQQPNL